MVVVDVHMSRQVWDSLVYNALVAKNISNGKIDLADLEKYLLPPAEFPYKYKNQACVCQETRA